MRRSVETAHGHSPDIEQEIPSNAQLKLNYGDRQMGWVDVWMDKDMNPVFFHRATQQFLRDSMISALRGDDSSTEATRAVRFFDANEVGNVEILEEKRFEHGMKLDQVRL